MSFTKARGAAFVDRQIIRLPTAITRICAIPRRICENLHCSLHENLEMADFAGEPQGNDCCLAMAGRFQVATFGNGGRTSNN